MINSVVPRMRVRINGVIMVVKGKGVGVLGGAVVVVVAPAVVSISASAILKSRSLNVFLVLVFSVNRCVFVSGLRRRTAVSKLRVSSSKMMVRGLLVVSSVMVNVNSLAISGG